MINRTAPHRIKAQFSASFFLLTLLLPAFCFPQSSLFQDDFDNGNANSWLLEEGWQVLQDDGNFVLSSSQHSFAKAGSTFWTNYSMTVRVKLQTNNSGTHLNYRNQGCDRYFVAFNAGVVSLSKTYPCGTHAQLASVSSSHALNQWYTVKIVGDAGNIKVYVDDLLQIDFTDPAPLLNGGIAIEGLDNSSVYYDDVAVVSNMPSARNLWRSTGGPLGGLGYDVRIHPHDNNILYVTDNWAGVVRSYTGGKTWSQTNSGITIRGGTTGDTINIFSLTVDPNDPAILWSGTNGEGSSFGVYKSTDGGTTWIRKIAGMALVGELGLVFRGFTIQQGNSDTVYAQAEIPTTQQGMEFNKVKGRVYKTTDGGNSWELIWQGDNLARYLIIDPNNPNVLFLSTGIFDREAFNSECGNGTPGGLGVLKSSDGGTTWAPINTGLDDLYVGSLRIHPTNPQILFAATGNNACSGLYTGYIVSGLFKTINGGVSWTKVIANALITTVNFSPSSPNIIYAGSAFAFYKSQDGGTTWSRLTKPTGEWGPPGIRAGVPIDVTVDPANPSIVYVNNYGGGVFRSLDGATTWEAWSKGYSGADIHVVHIPTDTPSSVFAIGRSGPFISKNFGFDWEGIANGGSFAEWNTIATHPTDSRVVLISDEHQGVILYSNDSGNSFEEVLKHPGANASDPNKRQGFRCLAFATSSPNVVYAGLSKPNGSAILSSSPTGTVIYKSQDGGMSFSSKPSVLDGTNVRKLVVDPVNADIVYAATTNGVYKSANGAQSWACIGNLGSNKIEALAIDPSQPGYLIAGEIFGGIWRTVNGGTAWTGPHNSGFSSSNPYISSLVVDPVNPDTVFAGDFYSGIYQSLDKGSTWTPYPDWMMSGLSVRSVKDLAVGTDVMYAATQGGGVFRFDRTIIPGDINGDRNVNLKDAVIALQILSGILPEDMINSLAEIDGDDKIGVAEVISILQGLAGSD